MALLFGGSIFTVIELWQSDRKESIVVDSILLFSSAVSPKEEKSFEYVLELLLASVIVVLLYAILPIGRYLKISPAPAGRISRLPSSFDLEESYVRVSLGFSDCHWIRPNDMINITLFYLRSVFFSSDREGVTVVAVIHPSHLCGSSRFSDIKGLLSVSDRICQPYARFSS